MKIIAENQHYIAVYKEAGLPVETRKFGTMDLEHLVMKHLAGRNPGKKPYVAVINRLDQPVEGLVLLACDKSAAARLSEQLRVHEMQKTYLAVCRVNAADEGEEKNALIGRPQKLVDYLFHDRKNNLSSVQTAGEKSARRAELTYTCLEIRGEKALVQIRLKTGRHHQIRVQMAHAGMPICGDTKYGCGQNQRKETLALCSVGLDFHDPVSENEVRLRIHPQGSYFREFSDLICRISETELS